MLITTRSLPCLALFLSVLFGLAACNTVQGLGKDVEKVGEEIQEGAD